MSENKRTKIKQGITDGNRQMEREDGFFDDFCRGSISAVADQCYRGRWQRERAEAIMTEAEPIDTPDKISFFPGKRFAV